MHGNNVADQGNEIEAYYLSVKGETGQREPENKGEIAQCCTNGEENKTKKGGWRVTTSLHPLGLRKCDVQKGNHGGMAQECPSMRMFCCQHTCLRIQGETEKTEGKNSA